MLFALLFLCFYSFNWFVFFKQKTAYEMRISDWSSDVCSSDLQQRMAREGKGADEQAHGEADPAQHRHAPELGPACSGWARCEADPVRGHDRCENAQLFAQEQAERDAQRNRIEQADRKSTRLNSSH